MLYLYFLLLVFMPGMPDLNQPGQNHTHRQIEVEVEPVAYFLGGAGGHLRYFHDSRRISLEVFGLQIPRSLHGHDAFDASTIGVELHFEYFFGDDRDGWFLGPEIGVSNLEVTHRDTGVYEERTGLSAGVRGGYRWYPGWYDFYFAPVAGLVYSFSNEPVTISGDTFETGPFTPFVTIGIGYSFDL